MATHEQILSYLRREHASRSHIFFYDQRVVEALDWEATRVRELEAENDTLGKQHQAELTRKDALIASLREEVKHLQNNPPQRTTFFDPHNCSIVCEPSPVIVVEADRRSLTIRGGETACTYMQFSLSRDDWVKYANMGMQAEKQAGQKAPLPGGMAFVSDSVAVSKGGLVSMRDAFYKDGEWMTKLPASWVNMQNELTRLREDKRTEEQKRLDALKALQQEAELTQLQATIAKNKTEIRFHTQ